MTREVAVHQRPPSLVRRALSILRWSAPHRSRATKALWAPTPRILRRRGSPGASRGAILEEAVHALVGAPQRGVVGAPLFAPLARRGWASSAPLAGSTVTLSWVRVVSRWAVTAAVTGMQGRP